VQGGLFGRQTCTLTIWPNQIWISPRMRSVAATDQMSDLALAIPVAPFEIAALAVDNVQLFLGEQLLQGFPAGRFRSGGAESKHALVSVTGVPGVVAISVEHRVLGAVTLEEFAGVIVSGHVPTS
jgi:hypothetical protein